MTPCEICGKPCPEHFRAGRPRKVCSDPCRAVAKRRATAASTARAVARGEPPWRSARRKTEVARRKAPQVAAVNALKDVPCMDCGLRWPAPAMDFDHRPGEVKAFQISYAVASARPLADILAEAAKCDIVCACCHRIRTWCRHDPTRCE